MYSLSFQKITDRPIIDAVSPNDFMLIGDVSDGNIVKRVLVSSLPANSYPYKNLSISDLTVNPSNANAYFYQMEPDGRYIVESQGLWDFRLPQSPVIGNTIEFQTIAGELTISSALGKINFYNKVANLQMIRDSENKYATAAQYDEIFRVNVLQPEKIPNSSNGNVFYSKLRLRYIATIYLIFTGLYWVVRYRIGSIVPLV